MLEYILFLGIINIVFGFIWKWVIVLPISLVLALLRLNTAIYIVKIFGSYLLISLTALLTLFVIESNSGIGSLILYPLIGVFVIYLGFSSNAYEAQKQAAMEYDYETLSLLTYDWLFIPGAVILFLVTLFVPVIAINPLTQWLFEVIDWAYNLAVIGWLLRIGGALFLLSVFWYGFLMSIMLISFVVKKIKGEPKNGTEEERTEDSV